MTQRAPIDLVRAAAAGDRDAAGAVLDAVQDRVYELALRMLGHPADAEDAAQEILIVVLTHLGSFRGDSAFETWVWRIAANHLARFRKGRRETITLDELDVRLRTGLADEPSPRPDEEALASELRLRCTQAMLLGLDRDHRIAYILGDLLELSGDEAAAVLDIDPATFRKRLSRARSRLHALLRSWCGVYDEANPCRCRRQVDAAVARGLLVSGELDLSRQITSERGASALDEAELVRVASVLCNARGYIAPAALVGRLRELLASNRLEPQRD
jgi:RNA polymerase sigma factor (sigma-70 family)